ncbi:hypothetical protein P154DRAFT_532736 [Amniculicola lignicola CBS 123094]|uniref:Amidohydrolase-related domain-containing protein n=1 Tax=Amniculicola lignicola CBS 123094 TaxID=1392246 RepID=A0A6A5WMD5_9PLEO|nr:hypothetical protein P154DRAFT_532736 [Amniculicola lignicola CBS 123094]
MTSSTAYIAVEEFYLSPEVSVTSTHPDDAALSLVPPATIAKLKNLGPSRLRDMKASGISLQVISHLPINVSPKTCQRYNDTLYTTIDAKEAASELQRCVVKYKFVGGMLGFSTDRKEWGRQVNDKAFDALWAVAERYQVPIALRVMFPTNAQVSDIDGSSAPPIKSQLVTTFYSSHAASPLLFLRIFTSGVFDRFPHLRLILSQGGLGIPPLLSRIEYFVASLPNRPKTCFMDVWQNNLHITLADVLDLSTLRALSELIPSDRLLYATRYPWEERPKAVVDEARESGVLGKEEWEGVVRRNAERLFKVVVKEIGGAGR